MSSYSLSAIKTAWRIVSREWTKRISRTNLSLFPDKISYADAVASARLVLEQQRAKAVAALAAEEKITKQPLEPRVLGDDEMPRWLLTAIREAEAKSEPSIVEKPGVINIASGSRLGFVAKVPDERSPKTPVISIADLYARRHKSPAA